MIGKVVFWMYAITCFYSSHGIKSTMAKQYDTLEYNFKRVDTVTAGFRYDTIVFFVPTQLNTVTKLTFEVTRSSTALDSARVFINGYNVNNTKLTNGVNQLICYFQSPTAMTPNKVLIQLRVKAGTDVTQKIYLRNYWIIQ